MYPKNEVIKYVHLFNYNSHGFTSGLIKLLTSEGINTNCSEHLFVVRKIELYDSFKTEFKNANIILDLNDGSLINKYANRYQWVFVHGFMSIYEIFTVRPKYLHRIVWRSWGSDSCLTIKEGHFFANIIKTTINCLRAVLINRIALIGLGSELDRCYIENRYRKVKAVKLPYSMKKYEILTDIPLSQKDDSVNILIGHSGFENDFHKEMIRLFSKYSEDNIRVYFPLSYGTKDYIEDIKKYASSVFGEKAVFINEEMDYKSYAALLSKMDLSVFYGLKSYALGNISILSFFKKWIMLNEDGLLQKAFVKMNIPYIKRRDIEELSLEELGNKIRVENNPISSLAPCSQQDAKSQWNDALMYLQIGHNNIRNNHWQ